VLGTGRPADTGRQFIWASVRKWASELCLSRLVCSLATIRWPQFAGRSLSAALFPPHFCRSQTCAPASCTLARPALSSPLGRAPIASHWPSNGRPLLAGGHLAPCALNAPTRHPALD